MKISDIQNLETDYIMSLSQVELKQLVKDIAKVVNPKVNKLSTSSVAYGGKIATDALDYINKTGGLISPVGQERRTASGEVSFTKTVNELRKEVIRGQHFLNLKTSKISEARKIQKQRMGEFYNSPGLSFEEKSKRASEAWDNFHKFIEEHPNIPYKTAVSLYQTRTSGDVENFTQVIETYLKRVEEEEQKAYEDISKQTGYRPQWEGI